MKQFWLKENQCTGCAACLNACPCGAIEMKKDKYGFCYPQINEKCIECNLCEKVCSRRKEYVENNREIPKLYAAWSKQESVRFTSTSGGAFSELANVILRQGGVVVGAQYSGNNLVEHKVVDTIEGLERIKQSKYIQSNIGSVYREIKSLLLSGKIVGFSGAPCQVAGLYAFLGKKYDNLITIDFICRGVNSPKAYRAWLDEIENENHSTVKKVWFKYKKNGWKKSPLCTRVEFENGKYIVQENDRNLFMKGYLGPNLYIRPSCGECEFKGVPRQSDITLADFWGLDPTLDDDKGVSMVLINSEKGDRLFDEAKKAMEVHNRNFEEILAGNACFNSSVNINPKSKEFLKALDDLKFSEAILKYTKISFAQKVYKKIYIYWKYLKSDKP